MDWTVVGLRWVDGKAYSSFLGHIPRDIQLLRFQEVRMDNPKNKESLNYKGKNLEIQVTFSKEVMYVTIENSVNPSREFGMFVTRRNSRIVG